MSYQKSALTLIPRGRFGPVITSLVAKQPQMVPLKNCTRLHAAKTGWEGLSTERWDSFIQEIYIRGAIQWEGMVAGKSNQLKIYNQRVELSFLFL